MIDERFPNWDVDVEKGTIYSLYSKKYIGSINEKGYLKIQSTNKKYKHKGVHQYIWMVANQADIPEGYEIHHIDGNKLNNSIYNLELVESSTHLSEHKKGKQYRLGKHHSEETKMKISKKNRGKHKGNKHRIGKSHSEETKKKMSESKIGKYNNPKMSKQVAQYTLEGELVKVWESAMEAQRNGYQQGVISKCCNGKLKSHKGFIWKYIEEKDVA